MKRDITEMFIASSVTLTVVIFISGSSEWMSISCFSSQNFLLCLAD